MLNHQSVSFTDNHVVSVANPWECDSVMGGSDESLCSQRTRLTDCDDDDDETESYYDESNNFRRRSSTMDQRTEADDEDGEDPGNGDWQTNDSLFLADGSRNSKLRDTIRNALYVSKFDSISTLIASNVVLRKKPVKARRGTHDENETWGQQQQVNQRHSGNHSVKKTGASREIVLGKRDVPMFVAVLIDDKRLASSSSPNTRGVKASSNNNSPKSLSKKTKARGFGSASYTNPLASPPRIRDLVDPGFHEDNHSPVKGRKALGDASDNVDTGEPGKKASVCFNCWSSSNGRFCEIHRDPNESRKVKASESALMCANWDLDQLRRKYRAEEIQEVFMKQNASLRYDKKLKQYMTVVECKHPIYRTVDTLVATWNKTMRRKLHTRAWFRSFIEQLRAGGVPRAADSKTPGLLKLKNTLQNNRWCSRYSDSVREFHPQAPVTLKNLSGQTQHIPDVIMVHPAQPQLRNWVLKTEFTKPVELNRPRSYELPPRRCVPMPSPSFLEDIPMPVPNVFIDCGHIASWLERLCARISAAALNKAGLQINACSPPPGFNEARRTKHATPLTVMFATFGRKPTPGNVAVGGLSAELLIHMLVTTYVPAQFGNFIVFERRAIAPALSKDHDAQFACLAILAADPLYVFRSLEHALNVRRPPCIVLTTRAFQFESDIVALESNRFPVNRPEQTGEELANGFCTFWLVDAFAVPDNVESVLVTPNSDILSPNSTSMNTTVTTKVDRFYPFCIPTTKENTPIEFIHLLWIGQSSRNQPQVFTTLGAQQPGDFMKNSNPNGALGVCTSVIYRSWAFMQSSPYEEFITNDGVAYWYDKQSGETFWTRPILPSESYRGKDGDVDGVVADGEGEVATLGIGAGDHGGAGAGGEGLYPQQIVRKYMTKSMEAPDDRDRRVRQVAVSAKKHDIVIELSSGNRDEQSASAVLANRKELKRIQVPQLAIKKNDAKKIYDVAGAGGSRTSSPVKQQQQSGGSRTNEAHGALPGNSSSVGGGQAALDVNTKQLIDSITQALGQGSNGGAAGVDMLQLGIGLGMGLSLRAQQQQQQPANMLASSRSDRSRGQQSTRVGFNYSSTGGLDLGHHDEGDEADENDDDMSTFRSDDSSDSGGSFSARSTVSNATTVDISLPPDEQELQGDSNDSTARIPKPAGYMEKKPGYHTHPAPGEGKSWVRKPVDASVESQTAVSGFGGTLHQRVACLPKDFVAAVTSTKTCAMQANYLPVIKNTVRALSCLPFIPRSAETHCLTLSSSLAMPFSE